MTTTVSTVRAAGLSSSRHVKALRSASEHFTPANIHKATLSTGITLEYALHSADCTNYNDTEPDSRPTERVVMVMGFLQTKEQWAPVLDMLLDKWNAQDRRLQVLTFDNRGVGGSDVPTGRYTTSQMAQDTLSLMDHVGWANAHVVGVSMGGMISLELTATHPERVQSLTLMVTTRGRYHADMRSWKPLLLSIFARSTSQAVKTVLALIYPPQFLEQRLKDNGEPVQAVLEAYHASRPGRHEPPTFTGMLGQALACQTHFVSDERLAIVRNARLPVLIIGCMGDILIPPQESIKLRQLLAGDHVETLFFENGGHGVLSQFMEEVADALLLTFQRSKL